MQGRAAAVYGLVFLLVAAASGAYVATAEAPEPSMQDPQVTAAEGESFSIEGPDGTQRSYTVDGFSTERGQPAATLVWTDDDARTQEEWEHAEDPQGTTVAYEGSDHYVRIPQVDEPEAFVLLEAPPEEGNVSLFTDEDGNWIVDDDGEYVPLEEYEALQRVEFGAGDSFDVVEDEETRTVQVEEITQEAVAVSWNEPVENEVLLRQTDREELNGVNVTAHVPGDGTLQLTDDEAEIERYLAAHEDRELFELRTDGLVATSVLSLSALVLLLGLAFLPRKE